jgi:hypothetical protein
MVKMAYQPLYGTMNDGVGERSTHSCRGRVDSISFWLNSEFGEVMKVQSDTTGDMTSKSFQRIEECKEKLEQFKDKPKKVAEWTAKREEAEKEYEENKKKQNVRTNITVRTDKPEFNFNICVNGQAITQKELIGYIEARKTGELL